MLLGCKLNLDEPQLGQLSKGTRCCKTPQNCRDQITIIIIVIVINIVAVIIVVVVILNVHLSMFAHVKSELVEVDFLR